MADDYKELLVWQKSVALTVAIYEASRTFPPDERFGLTNQMRRAAISIPSNIAEGQGRKTKPDFIRFLRIANGSRQELETQMLIAVELNYLNRDTAADLAKRLEEIARMLSGLIKSLI